MASSTAWKSRIRTKWPFELDEYLALSMAISTYVYPYRRYQESIKTAIYAAATAQEVRAIVIDYSSVEVTI